MKEFNVSLEYTIKKAIQKLRAAEKRGHHCKATLLIPEYYQSWTIDEIDKYLLENNIRYIKEITNKEYVIYKSLEIQNT